jgi:hypothetical protein
MKRMGKILILVVMVIYALTAADLAYKGNVGLAIAFLGYAFSNIGLYLVA